HSRCLSPPPSLVGRIYGKYPENTDTGHSPKAHRSHHNSLLLRHEDMFLPGIFPEALNRFCRPPADLIDIGIFPERGLLYVKDGGEIRFGRGADVNHRRSGLMCLKLANVRISKPGRIFYLTRSLGGQSGYLWGMASGRLLKK